MKRLALFILAFLGVCYLQIADADAQFRRECRYGFCVPGGGPSAIPVSNACSTVSGTTITFTAQGTGGPKPSRISVVSINWSDSTAAGTAQITGMTLGGSAMTRAVRVTAGVANSNSEVWYIANPTGTTANIVITAATAINGVTIAVYSLIGYDTVIATTTGTTSVSQAYTNKQLALAAASRTVNVSTALSNMVNDFSSACGAGLWGVHASQRLNGTGTLTSTISPTASNPKIALTKWSVGFVASCAESTAFINRTSGLDNAHKINYDQLICGLVTDGIFAKIDVLHVYATQGTANAILNLKSTSFNGTVNGAPTFTTDRGYTGTNSSSTIFIDTGFNGNTASSPQFLLNNAHLSVWQVTNVTAGAAAPIGVGNGTALNNGTAQSWLAGGAGAGASSSCLNQGFGQCLTGFNAGATADGHYLSTRSAAATAPVYKNGAAQGQASTNSSAIPNFNFYSLATNESNTAIGVAVQVGMISIGGFLTPTEITNFYNRLRTYMTAVGVP